MFLPSLAAGAAMLSAAALPLAPPATAATPPTSSPAPAALPLPKNLTPVDEIPAQDASDQIAEVAKGYPDAFGGTEWDEKSKTLYVNVAAPSSKQADRRAAFQQAIGSRLRSAKSPVKTVVRSVPLSMQGKQALVHTFMESRAAWGGESAVRNVVSAVVDERTGHLFADVTGDLNSLQQAAQRRFGKAVTLRSGRAIELWNNRYFSSPPWAAGNALWNDQDGPRTVGGAYCTQGFNWRRWSDNLGYASTAGHCFAAADNVFNGSTTQRMGYVGTRYINQGEYADFEYIRLTYGYVENLVWVGGTPTAELRRVVTADNNGAQTGDIVCSSGANYGLYCGRIFTRTASFTYDDIPGKPTLYNLTCVHPTSGYGGPGDSGGPILTTASNGTVKAWGQMVGGKDCDKDGNPDWVFTTVKNISARVGASIIVS
jgi:hypothetical protein